MKQYTVFVPRVNTPPPVAGNEIAQFGVPGIPFPTQVPVTPVFSQGEDVIYDGVIYVDGVLIDPAKWNVSVVLKKSEYAIGVEWEGVLGNGLYYTPAKQLFQVWIPAGVTSGLLAGTYWFDVKVAENKGSGSGVKDRTMVVLTTSFSIAYTMTSPNPDTTSALSHDNLRSGAETTYPNLYNPLDPSL